MLNYEREFLLSILKGRRVKERYYLYRINGKKYFEHVIIMELMLNRKLKENEVVHHIDGNKFNNDFKNLRIMDKREHVSLHHAGLTKNKGKIPSNKLDPKKLEKIKLLSKTILKKNGLPNYEAIGREVNISGFTVARYLK